MAAWWLLRPGMRETTGTEYLWGLAMLFSMLIARTFVQFAVMRNFGARPKFRVRGRGRSALDSGWAAEGYRFTKRQFAAVSWIPVLFTAMFGVLCIALTPVRAPLGMFLLVFYLLVEARALWYSSALALRQPQGTLFEEYKRGTRLYLPQRQTA